MTNTGPVPVSTVNASDALPANVAYVTGTMKSGPNCASATTAEDEDSSGADESDAIGMALSGTTVSGATATLAVGNSIALVFDTTVN